MHPDSDLIRRLKQGEMGAFDALFRQYRRGLFGYVIGMVRERQAAEDIVQDTFVKLVRGIDGIRPDKGVSPWLYRVARNGAIDHLRQQKRLVSPEGQEPDWLAKHAELPVASSPTDCEVERERLAEAEKALHALPEKERELLMLRFYGDLTFREIADVLGRPLGTVLWQARNTLQRMRRTLLAQDARNTP